MKIISQTIITALGIGLAVSASAYEHGGYFDYAHVDRVDRVVNQVEQPVRRQECWQEPRDEYHPGANYRRDDLGSAVEIDARGGQTVHGEVVENGGYVTHRLEENCVSHIDYSPAQQTVGYDVVYTYRGQDYHDRMSHDPGTSVRVHIDHGYVELAE